MTNDEGTNDCKCSSKPTNDPSPEQPAAVAAIADGLSKQFRLFSERAKKPPATIHRVPEALRKLSESAYTPRLVSIGPLHCEDKHLKSSQMQEDIKMSYVNSLLDRIDRIDRMEKKAEAPRSKLLQDCVTEMRNLLDRAKENYAGEPDKYLDRTLTETMLVTDGCFILELFYRHYLIRESKRPDPNSPPSSSGTMPATDRCFILKLFYRHHLIRESKRPDPNAPPSFSGANNCEIKEEKKENGIDLVFSRPLVRNFIQQDLLLLENQLPFCVLDKLFNLTLAPILQKNSITANLDLGSFVLGYFDPVLTDLGSNCCTNNGNGSDLGSKCTNNGDGSDLGSKCTITNCFCPPADCVVAIDNGDGSGSTKENYHHILHFLHDRYRPHRSPKTDDDNCNESKHFATDDDNCNEFKHSATDLVYAGVKFEPPEQIEDRLKVNFREVGGPFNWWRRGRFRIPTLRITDTSEPFLRNLIAFEQCCPSVPNHITWYAYLMDTLINDAEDVRVLEKAKVLCNTLGSHKEASNLFNKLCQEVVLGEFYFASECKRAVEYSDRWLPKNIADLKRNYFSSPWTCAAFVVAFLAFGMALTRFIRSF